MPNWSGEDNSSALYYLPTCDIAYIDQARVTHELRDRTLRINVNRYFERNSLSLIRKVITSEDALKVGEGYLGPRTESGYAEPGDYTILIDLWADYGEFKTDPWNPHFYRDGACSGGTMWWFKTDTIDRIEMDDSDYWRWWGEIPSGDKDSEYYDIQNNEVYIDSTSPTVQTTIHLQLADVMAGAQLARLLPEDLVYGFAEDMKAIKGL